MKFEGDAFGLPACPSENPAVSFLLNEMQSNPRSINAERKASGIECCRRDVASYSRCQKMKRGEGGIGRDG